MASKGIRLEGGSVRAFNFQYILRCTSTVLEGHQTHHSHITPHYTINKTGTRYQVRVISQDISKFHEKCIAARSSVVEVALIIHVGPYLNPCDLCLGKLSMRDSISTSVFSCSSTLASKNFSNKKREADTESGL